MLGKSYNSRPSFPVPDTDRGLVRTVENHRHPPTPAAMLNHHHRTGRVEKDRFSQVKKTWEKTFY